MSSTKKIETKQKNHNLFVEQFDLITDFEFENQYDTHFDHAKTGPQNIPFDVTALQIFFLLWKNVFPMVIEELNTILMETTWKNKHDKINYYQIYEPDWCAWIAIWIQMGLEKKTAINKYWEKYNGNDWIKNIAFGRNKWNAIFRALYHCSDTLFLFLEPLLNNNFQTYWNPTAIIAIDEMIQLFKGKTKHKVYDKSKPTKWGLKYYLAVDNSHYCFWIQMYQHMNKEQKEKDITFHICKNVVDILPTQLGQYTLYGDNYYGSLKVANYCNSKNIKFTFGCRQNRPTYLFNDGLLQHLGPVSTIEKVAFAVNKEKNLLAMAWKDKTMVFFITNKFGTNIDFVMRKIPKEKEKKLKEIPMIVKDYTEVGMRQVDSFNQNIKYVHPKHKNYTWRRTHFLTLLKTTIVNSWIIYKWKNKLDLSQEDFLLILRNELVSNYLEYKSKQEDDYALKRKEQNRNSQRLSREKKKRKIAADGLSLLAF